MAINVFEGARRIAKIVAVIWVIGWSVAAGGDGYTLYNNYDNCIRVMPIRAELKRLFKDAGRWGGDEGKYSAFKRVSEFNKKFGGQCREIWRERKGEGEGEGKWWTQFLKDLGQKVFWTISGLLFLWAFTWAIGWIVRGFMGIPRGQDKKE